MKKSLIIATLAIAAMASCTDNEYLGLNTQTRSQGDPSAITFSGTKSALLKSTIAGDSAAKKLNNSFVVYGVKHYSEEDNTKKKDSLVFNNYQVVWSGDTAGYTTTNIYNWEYVGYKAYASAVTTDQSIKYWDFGAKKGYTFYAFSSTDISYPGTSSDKVVITKITDSTTVYNKGYKVAIKNGAKIDSLYFADRVQVDPANFNKPVVFTFRNMVAKVRMGFYETVPGYSVKIDTMFYDSDATAAVSGFSTMVNDEAKNFIASVQNVNLNQDNELVVTYYSKNDKADENVVKLTNSTSKYSYNLKLGSNVITATNLSTSSSAPTYDSIAAGSSEGIYSTVMPFPGNSSQMFIKLSYTLTSTDGSNEKIHVQNARVAVPSEYVQWKSNYAYTYLFKISDATNGTTGKIGDTEGLFPITFDAVVISADQEPATITSIASNSFTTYANGKIAAEYKKGDSIFCVLTNNENGAIITPTGIGYEATMSIVFKVTDPDSLKEAITEATVLASLQDANTNMNLEQVDATLEQYICSGTDTIYALSGAFATKFKPETAGTYAVVYCEAMHTDATYESVSAQSLFTEGTYYFKSKDDYYYAASGIDKDNFNDYKAKLYKKTADGTTGKYDVKVIIVK